MPKQKVKKSAPSPAAVVDTIVADHVEAVAARMLAARPAPESEGPPPGVTQGSPHTVGAPTAVGLNLSPAALKKLIAPGIKSLIQLGIQFGGGTLEDMAEENKGKLDDFLPEEFFKLAERIAHILHGGEDHEDVPHAVGVAAPSIPVGPPPTPA